MIVSMKNVTAYSHSLKINIKLEIYSLCVNKLNLRLRVTK